MNSPATTYEAIGGASGVRKIVEHFYPRVQNHALLAPLFPEDLSETIEKQVMFLSQFFGGPTLYSDEYGHPMMRARHMRFMITEKHAEAWLSCMKEALASTDLSPSLQTFVLDRLSGPAYHFVNTSSEAAES